MCTEQKTKGKESRPEPWGMLTFKRQLKKEKSEKKAKAQPERQGDSFIKEAHEEF